MSNVIWNFRRLLVIGLAQIRRWGAIRVGFSIMNRLYPPSIRTSLPIKKQIRYFGRYRIDIDTASQIEWCIFANGIYEAGTLTLLSRLLNRDDTVVEIGANIGAHTLFLSKIVDRGYIHAFEPFPPVFKKLQKNITENSVNNVIVHNIAIGDSPGTLRLFFNPATTHEGLASAYATYFPQSVEVEQTTLDIVLADLSSLHLIKMDIQGAEYSALCGATATLKKFAPFVLFEYDYNAKEAGIALSEILEYFHTLGYFVYAVNDNGNILPTPNNSYEGNLLASKNDLLALGNLHHNLAKS